MFSLEELFCSVDDFCARFEPGWKQQLIAQGKCRCRSRRLSLSDRYDDRNSISLVKQL